MKVNFIIMARNLMSLENGSFWKLYNDGSAALYINGDFIKCLEDKDGHGVTMPACGEGHYTLYKWALAKKHLPKCNGGIR